MPTFDYDRRYIVWGLGILENYLLSDDLFWTVGVRPPADEPAYPSLTLESLLLSMKRMKANRNQANGFSQTAKLAIELESLHSRWRVAWENKAARAFISRLRMWYSYLREYQELPEAHADRYRYEVRLRVFLEILQENAYNLEQVYIDQLYALDGYLKSLLISRPFIWDSEIQEAFPVDRYWYLYGELPVALHSGNSSLNPPRGVIG